MAKSKEPANLFYVLVVILGAVFLITACGYGLMCYLAIAPRAGPGAIGKGAASHALMAFMDQYGMQAMAAELLVLGAATFGAMWLDRFRALRGQAGRLEQGEPGTGAESGRIIR